MADVYDLTWFKEHGTLKSPEEIEQVMESLLPKADELSAVMMLSTDELFVELLSRVEYGESMREDLISTGSIITELSNRLIHMELLCEIAQSLEKQ